MTVKGRLTVGVLVLLTLGLGATEITFGLPSRLVLETSDSSSELPQTKAQALLGIQRLIEAQELSSLEDVRTLLQIDQVDWQPKTEGGLSSINARSSSKYHFVFVDNDRLEVFVRSCLTKEDVASVFRQGLHEVSGNPHAILEPDLLLQFGTRRIVFSRERRDGGKSCLSDVTVFGMGVK